MNRMAERQAGFVVAHLADLRGNSELGKVIVVKDEQCVEIDLLRPHPVACAGADAVDGRGDPVHGSDSTRSGRRRASRCVPVVPVQQVDSMLLSLQQRTVLGLGRLTDMRTRTAESEKPNSSLEGAPFFHGNFSTMAFSCPSSLSARKKACHGVGESIWAITQPQLQMSMAKS